MPHVLPNVYQELHECLFYGARLVVKNTFLDVDDAVSAVLLPKRNSLPILPSARRFLEEEDGNDTTILPYYHLARKSLKEVRTRAFAELCRQDVDHVCSEASTNFSAGGMVPCLSSLHGPPSTLGEPRGSEPHCLPGVCGRSPLSSMSSLEEGTSEEVSTTTFMIRSLPRETTRAELEQLLDVAGFAKLYDFIYLPCNFEMKECYGYGFVNLVSSAVAPRFVKHFHGYSWPDPSQKPLGVHESKALEGLDALIQRYRNSPLMHSGVPEEVQPAIYHDGVKVPFPSPTVDLKAPRSLKIMRKLTSPGQKKQK